nr:DUF4446 family protein [Nocardiopsis ganjiahuensis]
MVSIALLAGLGGLALGLYALNRTREIRGEYQVLAQRALAVNTSGADPRAVRDVAVLHYDALEEMSGARSFSLAMLNSHGDGVVVTSINGRTETRTYAKAVTRGEADHLLSPEEYRVIRSARLGNGVGAALPEPAAPEPARTGTADAGTADADTGAGAEEDAEALVTVVQGPEKSEAGRDGTTDRDGPADVPAGTPAEGSADVTAAAAAARTAADGATGDGGPRAPRPRPES